jgi:hypothetical protein
MRLGTSTCICWPSCCCTLTPDGLLCFCLAHSGLHIVLLARLLNVSLCKGPMSVSDT